MSILKVHKIVVADPTKIESAIEDLLDYNTLSVESVTITPVAIAASIVTGGQPSAGLMIIVIVRNRNRTEQKKLDPGDGKMKIVD